MNHNRGLIVTQRGSAGSGLRAVERLFLHPLMDMLVIWFFIIVVFVISNFK